MKSAAWQTEIFKQYGTTVTGGTIALIEERYEDLDKLYDKDNLLEYLLAATILLKAATTLAVGRGATDEEVITTLQNLALATEQINCDPA